MSERKPVGRDEALDTSLSALPHDLEPSRDLWPEIRTVIESAPNTTVHRRSRFGFYSQLAAGFVLVIVSAATTYLLTHDSSTQSLAPATTSVVESNGDAIVADYLRSRADLDRQFALHIAALPATTRAKLESSLADLRRAENEIVANLAQHPSDSLLHELLMSTYQSEAQLLADVSELPQNNSQRTRS